MFKKFFKKKEKISDNKNILIAALLVHAAKIDDEYTDVEKKIIKQALINLNLTKLNEVDELLKTLRLDHVRHVYIGNKMLKGISGGEKICPGFWLIFAVE
mgnify:CR=1 FL=1